ncbi:unnamed protein product, partial [Laminaria digitata]
MPISPLRHEPTTIQDDSLTPLLLGLDGGDLDGLDLLDDIFDPNASLDLRDLLSLAVDDPEPNPAGQQQQQQQQQPPPPPPQQQQQQSHDAGNDGDVSSVMSEVDFSPPYAGSLVKAVDVRSLSDVGEMTSWSNNETTSCCGASAGGGSNTPDLNNTPRTTTGWSTTSASEDSDDSSPMSLS